MNDLARVLEERNGSSMSLRWDHLDMDEHAPGGRVSELLGLLQTYKGSSQGSYVI